MGHGCELKSFIKRGTLNAKKNKSHLQSVVGRFTLGKGKVWWDATEPTMVTSDGTKSEESTKRRIADDKNGGSSKLCFDGADFLEDMLLSNFKSHDQASIMEVMIREEMVGNYLNFEIVEASSGRSYGEASVLHKRDKGQEERGIIQRPIMHMEGKSINPNTDILIIRMNCAL